MLESQGAFEDIKRRKVPWEHKASETLAKRGGKVEAYTGSDLPVGVLYTPPDLEGLDYLKNLGFPGEYPFTRGIYPTMYRGRLWTMRQYAGYGTAEESNRRYKYLLKHGQTGLSVAFDLPTQIGYDSDHPLAEGEVGKVGVAICSVKDMAALFQGIPLSKISTSMTINATAPQILAMYMAVAEAQGAAMGEVRGTVQNDLLKEYVSRGTYIYPPTHSLRLVVDVIEFCFKNTPNFNSISISGYHMREAGATAVQELAFTLANGIAYVDAAVRRGLPVDSFGPGLSFFFGCHNDLLEEVAKFRAARKLWARIMRERFKAKDPSSWMLRFHTQTCGCTLTAQQPEVNLLRVTLQALAAVLGGTQSLHTNSYDEALALPSEKAVKLALRTQQVIAHESGVVNTADPLGGSYMVEALTRTLEEKAEEYIDRIDAMGGAVEALDRGFYHREISDSAYKHQKDVEAKKRVVVGVNEFTEPWGKMTMKILRVDPKVRRKQLASLKALRDRRDGGAVKGALENLGRAAGVEGENLMPLIFKAVKAQATIGEISDTLRERFGEYRSSMII